MDIIFPKDKSAGSKEKFLIKASIVKPVSLQVDGDLGTDEITIKYSGIISTELTDAYDSDGNLLKFTQTNPHITFYSNARVQIDKPAGTANDIGLILV